VILELIFRFQNPSKSWIFKLAAFSSFQLIIQPSWSARGRLKKRPRAESAPETYENNEILSIQRIKRSQKASQLAQFSVYKDQTSSADSSDSDALFKPSPIEIGPQSQKTQSHISVEIPFQVEFHLKSNFSTPQNHSQNTTKILQSLAVNSRQRIPKIPQKWTENQLNNHTSMLKF